MKKIIIKLHQFIQVAKNKLLNSIAYKNLLNYTQPIKRYCEVKLPFVWRSWQNSIEYLFALSEHHEVKRPRAVLRLSVIFFTLLLLWATFFKIDQVVNAQGQVIANSKTQIVQSVDGGVLTELKVQEGDEVKQGQIIATLEKDRAMASFSESQGKVISFRMTVARLQAELAEKELVFEKSIYENYPDLVKTQSNLFNRRRQAYNDQLRVLQDNVRLAEEELSMNLPLEKFGDISKADILRLKRNLNEARGNLIALKNKYFQDASTELNKAQEDLNSQEQTLADRKQLLEHTDIVAPATGIVKSIRVTTLGGVIRQGDEILQILPTESDLIIEAKIKPADMAFIKTFLPAKVKLDAYDYSIFGSIHGIVSYVSADSLTEDSKTGPITYYRAKINIRENQLKSKSIKDIEVKPGMTATVDIKTGSRSILSYILNPLAKTLHQSMGEK
jgi:adhesin transport system membrane fusion protein